MWKPTVDTMGRDNPYPNFEALVAKMRAALGDPGRSAGVE
jgi:hypothetical protein